MPNEPSKEDVQWLTDKINAIETHTDGGWAFDIATEVYKLLNVTGRREPEPPEPKFKVGQVVRFGRGRKDYIWKIASREYRCGHWHYTDGQCNWCVEGDIRPLTPEEANLPPTPSALDKLTPEFFVKHQINWTPAGIDTYASWTCTCGTCCIFRSKQAAQLAAQAHLCEELRKLLEEPR